MAPVSTNIKIDPELKEQSQALFESLGLSLSAAVNIFLRQAVREQAIQDARRGVGLSRGFTSVRELMEDLDADD